MFMQKSNWQKKILKLWIAYEAKIILFLGFILVAFLAFQIGILQGQKWQQKPLIIEKVVENKVAMNENEVSMVNQSSNTLEKEKELPISQKKLSNKQNTSLMENTHSKNCVFVGSKNSNKYHIPSCRWAKRIKPENIVCFKSTEDALAKGYQADKNCIK